MDTKPQQVFNVKSNVVQGKHLLVQRNNAYEINEVGVSIWALCDGEHTLEQIAAVIGQEYEIPENTALSDCREFIDTLNEQGLLQ